MEEMCGEQKHGRVDWLDAVKFIGIFEIYLGHMGQKGGLAYPFVFTHHVALFFFVAGCSECFNKEKSILRYIKKRFLNLLLPFYIFGIISIVLQVILDNYGLDNVKRYLGQLLRGGIRNHFLAGALWFLSCMFVTNLTFQVIKKCRSRILMVGISLLLFYLARRVIQPSPIVDPSWIYNIDSMMYYMIYYTLGYVSFEGINYLLAFNKWWKKAIVSATAVVSFIYTGFLFFGIDKIGFLKKISIVTIFYPILQFIIILWFWIIVAFMLRNSSYCKKIGRETLYLCGGEYIIKTIISCFFEIVGMSIVVRRTLSAYIYTFMAIYLCDKFLVPVLKQIVENVRGVMAALFCGGDISK